MRSKFVETTVFIGLTLILSIVAVAQKNALVRQPRIEYLTFSEAQKVVESFAEVIPAELKKTSLVEQEKAWNVWEKQKDLDIRARLAQGDEDTLVNFLLFGVSFTKQPRMTATQISESGERINDILQTRLDDFIKGLEQPKNDERLNFAKQILLDKHGFKTAPEVERNKLKVFILQNLQRILQENESFKQILEAAHSQDSSAEFAAYSKLFKDRGLSLDTKIQPNFGIEEALKDLQKKGTFTAKSVKRVAVIGPGLDFTDKQEGFDFYPQQTIQPFALIDSLARLGLTDVKQIQLTTLDLSPRINFHIKNSQKLAQAGKPYTIQLPRDPKIAWNGGLINFWENFGSQIGKNVAPVKLPDGVDLKLKAVQIPSKIASRFTSADINIVLQSLNLAPSEKFDLIIATNILVYYDNFEQSLALLNIEKMLRPNGVLLSNNALLELPTSKMKSIGYTSVSYSPRAADGDTIVWYQNKAK